MPDDMPQAVTCPVCKARYTWQAKYAGRKVRCAGCRQALHMPAEPAGRAVAVDAPQAAGTGADEPRLPPEALSRRVCPACGAPVAEEAVLCVNCGLNLKTGVAVASVAGPSHPPLAGAGGERASAEAPRRDVGPRTGAVSGGPIRLADILKTPLHGDVAAEAFVLALGWFGWSIAIGTAVLFTMLFSLFVIALLVATVSALGWMARKYMSIAMQYESGAMLAELQRSRLHCLGVFLLVSLIAGAPAVLLPILGGLGLGGHPATAPLVLVLSGLWALLYWPMGIAMAGAYGTCNPVDVVNKIIETFPTYAAILAFLAVLVPAAFALSVLAELGLRELLGPLFGWVIGGVIGSTIAQYGLVCALAMMGMLLRKYKQSGARGSL